MRFSKSECASKEWIYVYIIILKEIMIVTAIMGFNRSIVKDAIW